MGGPGSGNWYRWNVKSKTESQKRIDIRWLKKQNYLLPGYSGSLSWSKRGENTGWINFRMEETKMTLSYRFRLRGEEWEDIEQEVYFNQTSCYYGGYRKWFLCTGCRKRVAVIYSSGKYFLCRHCCNLTYNSCNTSPILRNFDKADALREKIGGHAGHSYPIPDRPKGMHHKTYQKIKVSICRFEEYGQRAMINKYGWCL